MKRKAGSCAPASVPKRDGTRICGFAVPDPGGMEADALLRAAWTEAVFAGETVTAAGAAAALARRCRAQGAHDLARDWDRQGRAHMRGLH